MRKIIAIIICICLIIPLVGCSDKKAFELTQEAYNNLNEVSDICADMSTDIYEVWRLSIYEKNSIISGGCSFLSHELGYTELELREAGAYTIATETSGEDWDELSADEQTEYKSLVDRSFDVVSEHMVTFCVSLVKNAYLLNGKIERAEQLLNETKVIMKELSDKHSDYEHYTAIKNYYSTMNSFFEFLNNPTCTFDQMSTTVDDYSNSLRDFKSELSFVFDD